MSIDLTKHCVAIPKELQRQVTLRKGERHNVIIANIGGVYPMLVCFIEEGGVLHYRENGRLSYRGEEPSDIIKVEPVQ